MKKALAVLVFICSLTLPLIAQSNDRWQINRAEYGYGNKWMDVTDQVTSMVQNGSLDFQVSGQALGASSRRGRNRSLRLQLTNRDGVQRQMTYRDNQQVSLRVFDSNYDNHDYDSDSRGARGNDRRNDQGYNQNQRNDQGNDPNRRNDQGYDPDRRNDPGRRNHDANDNSQNYGNLQILRATYGQGRRVVDVTDRLNSQIQNGQLNLNVNSNTMGGDPAPGENKVLTMEYRVNGQNAQSTTREGETIRLPYGTTSSSALKQRFTCDSSRSYGRKYCAANTSGGVRLSRQLGDSRCTQGSDWDYDNNGVWVSNGCSAEFETGNGSDARRNISSRIPSGTEISVRTNTAIDSNSATVGQRFSAQIASDVVDSQGTVMIPRGANAQLVIRGTNGEQGESSNQLALDIDSVTVAGNTFLVSTTDLNQQGGQGIGANRKTGVMVGGGAAVGTVIGAILGGGKGAAIGAAVGAGAGLGGVVLTRGKEVRVPAESILNFKLDQELRLQASR